MPVTDQPIIELIAVSKLYGRTPVLKSISLSVTRGEVVAIMGASGSGKSTLLRCVNGLEAINSGSIIIQGNLLPQKGVQLRRMRTNIGMVFQSFNLFPHLTIIQNLIIAPMKVLNLPRKQAIESAVRLLDQVGLAAKRDSFPGQLSGGQQQRAAIARALCMEPDLIMFDEPTSALDPEMTSEVLHVMRELAADGMTMIIVSHELGFIQQAADRLIFMDDGLIVEQGIPRELLSSPREERTRRFVMNTKTY